MPTQAYRLRIRNAANTNDALVVTSVRTGTNPYIASVPSGDGQEVDLLTGSVRTGAYSVEVIDAATGTDGTGTIRVVTNQLYDADARMQLLSRAAFIEMSTDGGATFPTVWQAGYVSNINQVDAIRYSITISNTRRVEQTQQVFTWESALERQLFPKRGCLFGGPVIGGFGAKDNSALSPDSGGWEFTFQEANEGGPFSIFGLGALGRFDLVAGYFQPNYERKETFSTEDWNKFWSVMEPFVVYDSPVFIGLGDFGGLTDRDPIYAYPTVRVIISDSSGNSWEGTIRGLFTPASAQGYAAGLTVQGGERRMFVQFTGNSVSSLGNITPAITPGTKVRVRAVSNQVTPQSPLYIDEHPVDVAHKLYQLIGLHVTSASITAVKAAIGNDTRLACRITEPQTMAEFMEKALFGPFGFAARTTEATVSGNLSPVIEFFLTRELGTIPPTLTITDADLVGDTPPSIFDLDEATAVTGFVVTQKNIAKWVQPPGTTEQPPADMLVESIIPYQVLTGDTSTYSTRIVQYDLQGMVHQADSFVSNPQAFALSVANAGFQRFGRGAPNSEVHILRTSPAAAAKVGELVYINASFYPNKNYRIGESSVGARVAQVVRREERPESVVLKLVDAGWNNQPATAPTITIAASTTDPRRVAQFTITNAATLNSNGKISVAIEWATGATTPTTGTTFMRYQPGQIPTSAIQLPPVIPGTKVYVRARTEQPELFPSAWTNWQLVTLNAWPVPSALATANVTDKSLDVSWGLGTPTQNLTDSIEVYVYPGAVAPSNWQQYRWAVLPARTTSTTLRNLIPSTNYLIGVAFFDSIAQVRGAVQTVAVATAATATIYATRPAGLAIIGGVDDATLIQGVALALWPAVGADAIVIERAPDLYDGIIVTVNRPGTYAEIATVPANTTTYVDLLPKDGTKYWYRIKHRTPGKLDSEVIPRFAPGLTYTITGLMASATGVPDSLTRPSGAEAVITPASSWEAWTPPTPLFNGLVVKLYKTDPQNRVHYVQYRYRSRTGTTWGAWDESFWNNENYIVHNSSHYYTKADSLDDTKTYQLEWRLYGADNQGNLGYIRQGTTEYPLNYGVNTAIIKVQKQGFNSVTNKYEVWWRFYFQRGNNTLDEDGADNNQQAFTTSVIAASVRNQAGTTATGVTTSGTKTVDGWYAYWNSAATDNWVYEIVVDTAIPEQSSIQYQDTDNLDNQLVATTYGQTFAGPASQTAAGAVDWSDITGIPTSVSSLIEVVWATPSGESSNAIEVQGTCYDIDNAVYTTNAVYATVVVSDAANDAEPSSTATINAAGTPVGTIVAGAGTATAVFKTNNSGQFKIKVTETAAASRYIWVKSGGHQQVYVRARDGILQLTYS